VITDLGVFDIDKRGNGPIRVVDLAPGVTLESARSSTEAELEG
jgi:3-oxoacid CoA-transferase subunit B